MATPPGSMCGSGTCGARSDDSFRMSLFEFRNWPLRHLRRSTDSEICAMILYAARRLLGVVPVLALVAVTSFLLVYLVPGDPAMVMLGSDATPQQIQALRAQMGLDRSLPEQFVLWLGQALRGNLGESFFLGRPVTQALVERLPATMQLAMLSLLFSLLIGIPAGILAAVRQNSRWDQVVMVTAMGGISIPSFWLGLFLILV